MEHARFDEVRRAISRDPACLHSRITQRNAALSPLDTALELCSKWQENHEHCEHTGAAIPFGGMFTFRDRLRVMEPTILFMLNADWSLLPDEKVYPLHVAVKCGFLSVADLLVRRMPGLVHGRDKLGRTPLHVACFGVTAGVSGADRENMVMFLLMSDAPINAKCPLHWRTPLHELMHAPNSGSLGPPGLVRRRNFGSADGSLRSVQRIVGAMLLSGADIVAKDIKGRTPLELAVAIGSISMGQIVLDEADRLYRKVLTTKQQPGSPQLNDGYFGKLPEDVLRKIIRLLPPKDKFYGLGRACKGLRRLALSPSMWSDLDVYNRSLSVTSPLPRLYPVVYGRLGRSLAVAVVQQNRPLLRIS